MKWPACAARGAALAVLLLWSLAAFVDATFRFAAERFAAVEASDPGDWRLPSRGPRDLALLVRAVEGSLPAGSVVVVVPGHGVSVDRFFLRQWVAYLLPRQRIVALESPSASRVADYLISYGGPVEHPRLTEIASAAGSFVYRVAPP